MIVELLKHNLFMTGIISVAVLSIFLQWLMTLSLKAYVKASANMKTTKKKVMINLKNQFEAMHELNSQVRNMDAYVDKYLLKLKFMGVTYSGWEKMPFLTAGIIALTACAGGFYGYSINEEESFYAEVLFASGISLACLFVFFHIFGIKARKQQIHIQLVDYLDNYLANRLNRKASEKEQWQNVDEEMDKAFLEGKREALQEAIEAAKTSGESVNGDEPVEGEDGRSEDNRQRVEEDMEMLKRLIREMDSKHEEEQESVRHEVAASVEQQDSSGHDASASVEQQGNSRYETAVALKEQSDIELLEEFVQSFLS
ncbi:MAG: hypothetical protein IJ661_05155 [Lachnospiraceae bacterium]|nr:hypothetical protein [Lachnospiraceae bacterium]